MLEFLILDMIVTTIVFIISYTHQLNAFEDSLRHSIFWPFYAIRWLCINALAAIRGL